MNLYSTFIEFMKINNLPIKNSEYNEQVFGSWYIELKSQPFYRIVYDGRDYVLSLQEFKNSEWHEILHDNSESAEKILNRLTSELNAI